MSGDLHYTDKDGNDVAVGASESYILYTHGDTRLDIDKTSGGYHVVHFNSEAERDRALSQLARDHAVWNDDDIQINRNASRYGKHVRDR